MRAVYITAPNKAEMLEIPDFQPDGQRVLIKVHVASICGSDLGRWAAAGKYGDVILGHEYVGTVIDPGPRDDLKPGDRVTSIGQLPCGKCEMCRKGQPHRCDLYWKREVLGINTNGAYADRLYAWPSLVYKIPDSVDDLSAALIEPAAVGIHAARSIGVGPGDHVLIIGAGTMGKFSAMGARLEGAASITMTDVLESRLIKAKELGYLDDYYLATDPDLNGKIEKTFEKAVECSGAEAGIDTAMVGIKCGGEIALVGNSKLPKVPINTLMILMRECKLVGCLGYTVQDFKDAIALIAEGKLKSRDICTKVVRPEEMQSAFEDMVSGKEGKVLVDFR